MLFLPWLKILKYIKMKIEKLLINNYRGFKGKQNDLLFSPQLNVFVGINGAGKSSLLDLLAIFLNQFTVKLGGTTQREIEYNLNQLDINITGNETINSIIISAPWVFSNKPIFGETNVKLKWEIIRDFRGGRNNYEGLKEYIKNYQDFISKNSNCNIPIIKYFHSQRATNEKNISRFIHKRYLSEQLRAYDFAFEKNLEFDEFIGWFIEEENMENREKIARKDFNYFTPNLKIIKSAIRNFFEEFRADRYDNLRVEDRTIMSKQSERSSLVIDKNQKTYNLKQLSDGEKVLILMVSDIAHRLAIANPILESALNGSGIVLIDEIDLHLHPQWQREIIPCLIKTFPNLQFFITTHSPQVISSVAKENVFKIKDFQIAKILTFTQGRDTNSLLYDVFGINERADTYKKDIELLYQFIENNEKINAKNQLEKLTTMFGESDREIVRANMYYEDLID